jgi:Uma2 family endonuclease
MIATFKWSIKNWHELVESGVLEGKSIELLEGEIIEMSPEREWHTYTNDDVDELLREKFKGLAKIRESHPITLDNSPHSRASEPEPDIAIVRLPKNIYTKHHPFPEDIYWLIEVADKTLTKDLEIKSVIYARNKIPEYWVIDLVNKKVWVYTEPNNDRYSQVKEYTSGSIFPLAFPHIEVAVSQLLLF